MFCTIPTRFLALNSKLVGVMVHNCGLGGIKGDAAEGTLLRDATMECQDLRFQVAAICCMVLLPPGAEASWQPPSWE